MDMTERTRLTRALSGSAWATAVLGFASVGGCGLVEADKQPEQARVQIEVTATNPLQLVISTDFFEFIEPVSGEILASLNDADTFAVTGTFDQTIALGNASAILARLTETDSLQATVRMRVFLDGSLEYDRQGTIQDATLEYRYIFSRFGF